jgi:hypothetical protein
LVVAASQQLVQVAKEFLHRGRKCFKVVVSSHDLEINKAFLIEKNTGAVHNKFTDVCDALKLY